MNKYSNLKQKILPIFINQQNKVRNGWWILIFIALVALTRPLYGVLKNQLSEIGWSAQMLELLPALLLLLVTWICLALRKQTLTDVGLSMDKTWHKQLLVGTSIGFVQVALIAAVIYTLGGVTFSINPETSVSILASALYVMFFAAFFEELLFRGFIFQRLSDGTSFTLAQLIFALAFAYGHWANPGMEGMVKWVATVELALGALVLGLAYYRTKSLALPIGIHFGWNYCLGHVFGFQVSGYQQAGALLPSISSDNIWLTGGSFGLEASVVTLAIDAALFILLWRWQGPSKNESTSTNDEQALVTRAN